MTHPKVIETFEPLLDKFCQETINLDIGDNFSSIFLPHTMSEYDKAERKVFYFGRDTNEWTATKILYDKYKNNKLDDYISQTDEWINDYGFLKYNNNKAYGFWTLAMRLHLCLKGVKEKVSISKNIDGKHLEMLNDFGYGNTNAIEVEESLKIQGVWKDLDKEKYSELKSRSKPFDKLVHTIKAYKPDLVFIFNWACNEKIFLEGLQYEEQKLPYVNNQVWTYNLPETNTKVIWTLHPRRLPFEGFNVTELIDIIEPLVN